MVSHRCKTIWIKEPVIIKIQEHVNWISALSFVLVDFFTHNLDDGIENRFIKLAENMNLERAEKLLDKIQNELGR